MSYDRRNCILCRGYGKIELGSNIKESKNVKTHDCPICCGKGFISVWKDPWNNDYNKRGK